MPAASRSRHHLVPRSRKGRETVTLHRICHRKIHSLFTERDLARHYNTIEALLAHPDIQAFRSWVSRKPPAFYAVTRRSRGKGSRRA